LLNKKTSTPSKHKYYIISVSFLVVDAGEDLIMVDDVTTPSNPPVSLIEKEELEEAPLDVNVFQRSHKEKSYEKVVCTRVDCSAWDR